MRTSRCRGDRRPLVALFASLVASTLACSLPDEISLAEPRGAAERLPPAQLERVVFSGYTGVTRDLEVRAASASIEAGGRTAHLLDVVIALTDKTRGRIEIRAAEGRFHMNTDDFELRGEVIGSTREGERFVTRDVRYDQARKVIWTDAPVRLDRDNLVLTADGMEMDVATRSIKLIGHVNAELGARREVPRSGGPREARS